MRRLRNRRFITEEVSRHAILSQYAKNGVFRKFAFVGFLQEAEATNAVKLLDKSFLHSSRLSVQVGETLF